MAEKPHRPAARTCHRRAGTACLALAGAILWVAAAPPPGARAVTPNSPEVRKLVADGLAALEEPTDDRNGQLLGGKCLVGLAFVKANRSDHPRILDAIEACRKSMTAGESVDVYSNGLAIVFLCEVDRQRYAREIQWYLRLLRDRQKEHGGWGYDGNSFNGHSQPTGDTSQTQYATLGYWTAFYSGYAVDADSLENVADWLLRTQDPDGCWGYQGTVATTSELVPQSGKSLTMLAAGLGSALICADLLGAAPAGGLASSRAALPSALRPADDDSDESTSTPKIQPRRTNTVVLLEAIDRAHGWMNENYRIDAGSKTYYYLYAMERYQSFQEMLDGQPQQEPQWYNDGFEFLKAHQRRDGSWIGYCGQKVDTAFSVLFLLRSTQRSIQAKLGEGLLLSGRGLPSNLSQVKMRHGQIIVEQVQTQVDAFLALVDDEDISRLDELASDPGQLMVTEVDARSARQLQQLVRGGEPEVRLLAVRALGRTGNLDYVPSLLYALSDPDRRIVLEARDGLRFISRRFEGFGLPDDFTEQQRFDAISAWKEWYLSLRPNAILDP